MTNKEVKMLKKLINKIGEWKYKSGAKELSKIAKWELDPLNKEGGDFRLAADLHWLAIYHAERLGDKALEKKFREEAVFYQGYDPLKSRNEEIRELAFTKTKLDEVRILENMAAERFRIGLEEKAVGYYMEAFELAKTLGIQAEVKSNFEKVENEVRKTCYKKEV